MHYGHACFAPARARATEIVICLRGDRVRRRPFGRDMARPCSSRSEGRAARAEIRVEAAARRRYHANAPAVSGTSVLLAEKNERSARLPCNMASTDGSSAAPHQDCRRTWTRWCSCRRRGTDSLATGARPTASSTPEESSHLKRPHVSQWWMSVLHLKLVTRAVAAAACASRVSRVGYTLGRQGSPAIRDWERRSVANGRSLTALSLILTRSDSALKAPTWTRGCGRLPGLICVDWGPPLQLLRRLGAGPRRLGLNVGIAARRPHSSPCP